eukprot:XP_001709819.1 Hypothetical protein GL50803_86906 [Giardia lamblia ATCC 50803]
MVWKRLEREEVQVACRGRLPDDFADIRNQLIKKVVVFEKVDTAVFKVLKGQLSVGNSLELHSACGDVAWSHIRCHSLDSVNRTVLRVELVPRPASEVEEEDKHESQH